MTPAQAIDGDAKFARAFRESHGTPVHVGDPAAIGIRDLDKPDFGDPVEMRSGRDAGVLGVRRDAAGGGDGGETAAADNAQTGAMFVTDWNDTELEG